MGRRVPLRIPPPERPWPVPLTDLDAFIFDANLGGTTYKVLWFLCPLPGCNHGCGIPFSDRPLHDVVTDPNADPPQLGIRKVWKRVSGRTVSDITLSPSYWLKSSCGLHVNVSTGRLTR
jgi:hypothetical protein